MAIMSNSIPVMPKPWPLVKREYPVTPKENLMLALNQSKPVWMPDLYASSQIFQSSVARDSPIERDRDTTDWFGVEYKYSEAQCSNTPQGNVLNDITEWEDKIAWPDLDQFDWEADAKRIERDDSLALFMRMSNGLFERLHMLEKFEQALIDLVTEPETVEAYLFRLADFKIDLFNHIRDHVPFDYIIAADDWGTMRAPFFSTATFEKTILGPTKRFVKAVQARGTKFVSHCCGVIEPFVPYMVEEIGFDAIEIQQEINDISAIISKYGDRITVKCSPPGKLVHDPDVTKEALCEYARSFVETYGAHVKPGSGAVVSLTSSFEKTYYTIDNEYYEYSKSCYAKI